MKKNYLIVFSILFLMFIPNVFAEIYYETEDGKYALCFSKDDIEECKEIEKDTVGVIFDAQQNVITYNGASYYFSSSAQERYNERQYGKTRMFYYKDSKGNYRLCDTEKKCKTYSFDRLVSMGATINNGVQIEFPSTEGPGGKRTIYYYNKEKEDTVSSGNSEGDNTQTSTEKEVLEATTDYCTRLKEPLKFLGRIVFIVKIVIPIVIIAFGIIDLFRAVIGSKDDEIKKSVRSVAFRCIAGVVIFFLPTIISVVFSLISDFANIKGDFNACQKCIFNVSKCE